MDEKAIARENEAAKREAARRKQERMTLSSEEQESLQRPAGKIAKEVLKDKATEKRSFDYTNNQKDQPSWLDKRKTLDADDADWMKKAVYEEIKERPFF